jgi:hypothetical protein
MQDDDVVGPVRLRAQDADDLVVISALLQDALVPLSDMTLIKDEERFVLALNRYRWNAPKEPSRIHALLSFQKVEGVQTKALDRTDPNRIISLLGITYAGGIVQAEFSEGGTLRLRVRELECLMEDVGEPWPTVYQPKHEDA